MKAEKDNVQLVREYLCGELNKDELKWFKNELKTNKHLQAELSLQRKIIVAIQKKDIINLRKRLDEIYELLLKKNKTL